MAVLSERFMRAARRILDGDSSVDAAAELETVLVDENLGDVEVEDLLEALSLYGPGGGAPYVDAAELQRMVLETIRSSN